jgi:hypothetical protein
MQFEARCSDGRDGAFSGSLENSQFEAFDIHFDQVRIQRELAERGDVDAVGARSNRCLGGPEGWKLMAASPNFGERDT